MDKNQNPTNFSVSDIRDSFPIFKEEIDGKTLTYLDSAASAQKPKRVIDFISKYYLYHYANVHRGAYSLSENLTSDFEESRSIVRSFLNADSEKEIIFTKGATESINLVANSFSSLMNPGDEIIITELEHHSNIVPWQLIKEIKDIELKVVPINKDGSLNIDKLREFLSHKTKLVSLTHVSNVLGTILPVREIADLVHNNGSRLLVDGCQGIVHQQVDVKEMDCDFYVFSGHKMYGPNGIGILYGKQELLDEMPPYQGGGDMIRNVTFSKSEWADLPAKFEAGTPPIVPAIGLGEAIKYFSSFSIKDILSHEEDLLNYAMEKMSSLNDVKVIPAPKLRCAVISFIVEGTHPHDLATILDNYGVCIRAGHHCAQPLMEILGLNSTARISFGIYNEFEDIDRFIDALKGAKRILA